MDRRVLATVGVVALVLLAGCSYDTTIAVLPEVEQVESTGDAHELRVTVDPDLGNVDEIVSDVRVSGYSLDGERVCSADFGDVADRETRTLECDAFPTLLVADTPDRGTEVEVESDSPFHSRPPYTIVPMATLYRGHVNGTHQFDLAAWVDEPSREFDITDGRAVPTDEKLQSVQCRQWRQHRDGRNFSALGDAPWRAWELRESGTDRSYRLAVSNYSKRAERGQTDQFDLEPEGSTYAESDLPKRLRLTLQVGEHSRAPTFGTRFTDVVDGLSGAEVNASENVTAAMRGIDGRYGTYEDRRVDCGPTPPQQTGDRGEYVETYASYGGHVYHVRLETGETIEGNAFRNVTAP